MKVEAWITRKTRDLVQDSAEELLRRTVPALDSVRRAEVWSFEVEGDDPRAPVREILDDTTLVVNPNVHRYTLDDGGAPPASGVRLVIRVTERVDARRAAVLRGIRERCGIRSVTDASRSVVWSLDLGRATAEDAARIGREVGPILGNPHAQDVHVEVVAA